MMNVSQSVRVGAFFLLGVGLLWIVYETLSGHRISREDSYPLTATFNDIQQLKATSEVRMAGVRIGTVSSTGLDDNRARVEILIEKQYHIPADSKATIATAGMLGLNYLSITPGKDTRSLEQGAEIATVQTPDMSTIMAKLDNVGTRLDGVLSSAQLIANNIVEGKGTIGKLINEPEAYNQIVDIGSRIDSMVTNAQVVVNNIVEGKGTVGKLINDPAAYNNLMATVTDIQTAAKDASGFLGNTNEVVTHVRSGEGVLGMLVYDQTAADNLKATASNVSEFTTKLNDPDSSLGRFISNDTLYKQASNTLTKLDGAINSMNDAGPITAVGVLANALF